MNKENIGYILSRINKMYLSIFYNGTTTSGEMFMRIQYLLMFLNILYMSFILLYLYFFNSILVDFLASIPAFGYEIILHYYIHEAKSHEDRNLNNHFAKTFIQFGHMWTLLTFIIQVNVSIGNVHSTTDKIFFWSDIFLVFMNIPLISALQYYFSRNSQFGII